MHEVDIENSNSQSGGGENPRFSKLDTTSTYERSCSSELQYNLMGLAATKTLKGEINPSG